MIIKILQSKLKLIKEPLVLLKQCSSNVNKIAVNDSIDNFKDWKKNLHSTLTVYENYLTIEEEKSLLNEVDPYLQNLKYETSHWDDMIHGYRETEYCKWNEDNLKIINKIKEKAFPSDMEQLKLVHVLDLAEDGWIKPHVDSIKFCGEIIATVSLLSDCVMRFTYVGHEEDYWDDFFIPRRSLYIMKGVARYKYNHEILCKKESVYNGNIIDKTRRISVICRSKP
ncbi:PREDICTED: alpha-ketoglutarate-dependent dioxygenase alkB homolog 7, mitochondrial [Ceratosolen solmsi marchali]|uniref:Alpha-ketoglutarate-dependent dioxygenase alkB homolog 7, mitochondrial n=1 Tax=Ceratosolen solmsi marchali TaxID=326594 RepID=A0AAJ6YUX0_9HYME|nr:PREDICTED: alpha-ketoglutarate-dependent dioxygenase alkB homolog 7, mitochondrial [Ceratosolen solmsi marchali]